MKRILTVTGTLMLGIAAVAAQQDIAVQQDNLMRSIAKNMYGVMGKMIRGDTPYDQAAVDAALKQIEGDVGRIAAVFTPNPKEDVVNATYGSSQKIWQNKADFESKIPPVLKALADVKGKATDVASLKVAFKSIDDACNGCHETYRVKLK